MREEGRGERESVGKKDKGKLLDKHKYGRALCVSESHEGLCVCFIMYDVCMYVCASYIMNVCSIMYDVSMFVRRVCVYKGQGKGTG